MAPSPYKIFCIGVIWFIYTLMTFIRFLKYKIRGLIHFIHFSLVSFIYHSEKEYLFYLNKSKSIKFPNNISIILNKFFIGERKVIISVCQIIRWAILTNQIKILSIYDPFNLIDINQLNKEVEEQFNNNETINENIYINISYKDSKNEKLSEKYIKIEKKENNKSKSSEIKFNICLISFNESNNNLLNTIVKNKEIKIYGNYPDVYKWFNHNNNNKDVKIEYEKFLTRKNEDSLPELVIIFGKNKYLFYEDICLYGFPFTLLENTEIININHKQIDQIDIIDFIDIFDKNSKIIKRFGA
jgi:hypothetical protein